MLFAGPVFASNFIVFELCFAPLSKYRLGGDPRAPLVAAGGLLLLGNISESPVGHPEQVVANLCSR